MEDLVVNWSIDQVCSWLGTIGFEGFRRVFQEEGITGDVLIHLDHECLLDLQMSSVGKRVLFMKAIYELKLRYNIPIYPEDYQPPPSQESTNIQDEMFGGYQIQDPTVISAFKERDSVIKHLVHEVNRLTTEISKVREEVRWSIQPKTDKSTSSPQPGKLTKNRPSPIMTNSPKSHLNGSSNYFPSFQDKSNLHSPHSPSHNDKVNLPRSLDSAPICSAESTPTSDAIRVYGQKLQHRENEAYKSFRISLDDPCYKVIPIALKKYKIKDNWQNYSLYIAQASGEEVKLDLDDMPLLIYQKLREVNASPMFVLKHNIKGRVYPVSSPTNPASGVPQRTPTSEGSASPLSKPRSPLSSNPKSPKFLIS